MVKSWSLGVDVPIMRYRWRDFFGYAAFEISIDSLVNQTLMEGDAMEGAANLVSSVERKK